VVASLHDQHYIHRDIKPSNFTIQVNDVHPTIFLIDFSLAQQFRNPATYLHTPYIAKHSIVGTLPFTSINGQQGRAQLHCNNLESLAYTIIFFTCGDLPWTSDSIFGDHEAVLQKKTSITAEELCKGLPPPFSKFIIYVCCYGSRLLLPFCLDHMTVLSCDVT
jgi:casein kinase 1 alpha